MGREQAPPAARPPYGLSAASMCPPVTAATLGSAALSSPPGRARATFAHQSASGMAGGATFALDQALDLLG